MPPGTPYHSFALPYPIRVDNFTDTLDDLPPPYNRPPLHLLTHMHSDHIHGLASKSFAYPVVCSPDTKEMLLRHEKYSERSLHDYQYRTEKKRTFEHLKIDPLLMPSGQKYYTGSRDLLHAIPPNTPTEFELSNSEAVMITLIDANHCPGSVMFLIEGPRGTVLHTGDLRAEPWFLSSIKRNHFLRPYLANISSDLRILVARREGAHAEAKGLVKTLEAIYLDTACLLSSIVVPSKDRAVQGIVELMALFPSTTHFFINAWTWGYEDILKGIAHAFHCKIHFDRYKNSIYSNCLDPFLRVLGTLDASSTRFHACERLDRCSFVDVPLHHYETKGAVALPSKEGKEVVYVNAVNMSSARWEDYQANVRRQIFRGENVNSLLVPLSRHSHLPELMSFVTLFRPLRVVPNTLDPSLNGLDWGAMSKIFSGCLSPVATSDSLASVMAPPCILTSHRAAAKLPGPSIKGDFKTVLQKYQEGQVDTAYSNLVGPSGAADVWSDKGGKSARLGVLKSWLCPKRRNGLGRTSRGVGEDDDPRSETNTDQHIPMGEPSRQALRIVTPKGYPHSDESDQSSDEGRSDEHARTAWMIFGLGKLDGCKTWLPSSPQSPPPDLLPTPNSSPPPCERCLVNMKQEVLVCSPEKITLPHACPEASPTTPCTSPFVSFGDARIPGPSPEELAKETVELCSQLFTHLDNVVLSTQPQALDIPHNLVRRESQSQQTSRTYKRALPSVGGVMDTSTEGEFDNVDEVLRSKRCEIDQGDSGRDGEEEHDAMTLLTEGTQVSHLRDTSLVLHVRDDTNKSLHDPLAKPTRIPAVPSLVHGDNEDVFLPPAPQDLEPGESSGARVITAATITFPVRKRVKHRNFTRKSVLLSKPTKSQAARSGSVTCLSVALAQPAVSTIDPGSWVVGVGSLPARAIAVTLDASASPPVSPRTATRRAERALRRRTTEKLRLARPELAIYPKSPRRGSRRVMLERKTLSALSPGPRSVISLRSTKTSAGGVTEEDMKMDWEKSRSLSERVREAIQQGDRIYEVLPRLACLEQWYAERSQ